MPGPAREARPRDAGVLAREVAAFLASVGERARAAEVAAAETRATAAAERRAGRRIGGAGAGGRAGHLGRGRPGPGRRARASRRAEAAVTDLAALSWKADWFRDQAARIPPDQLGLWAQALAHVRRTAQIVSEGAPDEATARDVRKLVVDLRLEEERVRERAEQYASGRRQGPAPRRGRAPPRIGDR